MDFQNSTPAYDIWFPDNIYHCRHDWIKCLHQEKTMVTDTGSADTSEVPDEVTYANNNDNL